MKYGISNVAAFMGNPLGRRALRIEVGRSVWPVVRPLAEAYRRSVVARPRFVTVVGSFGKTTASRAAATALGARRSLHRGGNAFTAISKAVVRTRPWHRYRIVEVGVDQPGDMAAYARMLSPDVVIVTAIGSEHGRSFGDLETTRHEKAHMVRAVGPAGRVILNGDDANVSWMRSQTRGCVATYGRGACNDAVISDIRLDWPRGTRFRLRWGRQSQEVATQLVGLAAIYALAGGATAALAEGVPLAAVAERLAGLKPMPGRLEPVRLASGAYLLQDDVKSPLETIHAALDALEAIPSARKRIVLGDVSEPPGPQGPIYRALGERMGRLADRIAVLGGNGPRYWSGVRATGFPREHFLDAKNDRRRAARFVGEGLCEGDVVLIKGRDTQRLDRVGSLLRGETVGCEIAFCTARIRCAICPMLERGWQGRRVTT